MEFSKADEDEGEGEEEQLVAVSVSERGGSAIDISITERVAKLTWFLMLWWSGCYGEKVVDEGVMEIGEGND